MRTRRAQRAAGRTNDDLFVSKLRVSGCIAAGGSPLVEQHPKYGKFYNIGTRSTCGEVKA